MEHLHINVTSDGIRALESLSDTLNDLCMQMQLSLRQLHSQFEDHSHGLGAHTAELETLLDELDDFAAKAGKENQKLARKAARAAKIRRGMVEESPYRKTETVTDDQYIPEVLGRIYDDLVRQRIRPKELGPSKEVRGIWKDQVFYASDDFIPKQFNSSGRTFGQIRQELSATYGITFDGISYANGYPDFSCVSIAQLGLYEIVAAREAKDGFVNLDTVFKDRDKNFDTADQLAADKQLAIPGLKPGYSAQELAKWRQEKQFSWEESYTNGYLLVPSVVHGNLSHTGLVSVWSRGKEAEENFSKRHGGKA